MTSKKELARFGAPKTIQRKVRTPSRMYPESLVWWEEGFMKCRTPSCMARAAEWMNQWVTGLQSIETAEVKGGVPKANMLRSSLEYIGWKIGISIECRSNFARVVYSHFGLQHCFEFLSDYRTIGSSFEISAAAYYDPRILRYLGLKKEKSIVIPWDSPLGEGKKVLTSLSSKFGPPLVVSSLSLADDHRISAESP